MSCNCRLRGSIVPACLLAVITVFVTANSARAITVTNLTANEVIFQDDFESEFVGSQQSATVGIWDTSVGGANQFVSNVNPPGAFQGSQYLDASRPIIGQPPNQSAPDNQLRGYYSGTQATLGDVIQVKFGIYVPMADLGNGPQAIVFEVTGNDRPFYMHFITDPNAHTKDIYVSGVEIPTLANAFKTDQWQNWTVTYTISGSASSPLVFDVDGTTYNQPTQFPTVQPNSYEVLFDLATNDHLYLDGQGPIPLKGDFDRDGHVTAADIKAMQLALSNLSSYESTYSVSPSQFTSFSDVNGDGQFTNADLQSFLNYLKTGHGSAGAVPEPSSLILLALGGIATVYCRVRSTRLSRAGK